ncbi:MAG TPA: gliding motility-associated ABC transporter substrate-binding protein GldG, partial [Chitinophagaceae bacterium]|nr:gliding motility-associated ABC transporter substrate-binding protein GldG [Chitinophagaceae bacterium]
LLSEFQEYGRNNLTYKFTKPGEGLDDTARAAFIDSLHALGLNPTNIRAQAEAGEAQEERLVYAGALVSYGDQSVVVDLLQGQAAGGLEALNNAEALLEYKFASAINKVTSDSVALVGYLLGNGQPLTYNVYDLVERTLKTNYAFNFLNIDSVPVIPPVFSALVVVKPTEPFTDAQKLKLDQYVMNGGKLIWFVDRLYAEMDSLLRSKSDFVAFDRNLNLDDLLFRYGVRINPDLTQDLQCEKMPLVVGNIGNQPQVEFLPWPYFPLLSSQSGHPVAKNLDLVLSIFPNSVDTVKAPGLKKTILLSTSQNSRVLSTPAIVTLNTVKTEEDVRTFTRQHIPVAVLLEGKFNSLYANRLTKAQADTLSMYRQPFQPSSPDNKMIVVSDADIVTNVFTQNEGPLPMGMNQFNQYKYANRDFFLNCLEYLVDPSGILETRGKDYSLRLLDPKKVEEQRTTWQFINLGIPIVLVLLAGMIFQFVRKRKYIAGKQDTKDIQRT